MEMFEYIKPELLIMIPILNLIGVLIKNSQIRNKYIPLLLTFIAIFFCMMYTWIQQEEAITMKLIFDNILQGILISSISIYNHQLIKQTKEKQ